MEQTIRERTEALERQTLSPRACLSANSKGRAVDIEPCPMRTCFQRDVDRVVHCKSFRRLKHKTQVFLQPEGDHYRTRMTHTLEVSRIARTMARGLGLNEDLTEAAALAHDLGHTPSTIRDSARSPAWPKGVCPRSWARAAASVRSSLRPNPRAMVLAIRDTSKVWVIRVR